jgi:hypothetical protein
MQQKQKILLKKIFIEESTLKEHLEAQNNIYDKYLISLVLFTKKYKIKMSILKKAQILASSIHRNDRFLGKYLLNDYVNYDLPVILKTCSILDAKRRYIRMEKKLNKLKNKRRLVKHKSIMSNIYTLYAGAEMSLTSGKAKFIRNNWIQNISKRELEYNAIYYPINMWKKIIDILHLKPSDFKLNWFTKYVFEKICPHNSIIYECNNIDQSNIISIVKKYKLSWGYVKSTYNQFVNPELLNVVVDYIDLNDLVKEWDTFNIPELYSKICHRITTEKINMPYGELMKRIQSFKKDDTIDKNLMNKLMSIASDDLQKYDIKIEQPVVVFGDASSSMDVAIRTSSIIMSILCSLCNAKMHLFRTGDEFIKNAPRNVTDVIQMGEKCRASGLTSPVASLYPYLQKKEHVKTFVIVTDEIENTDYDGNYFTDLRNKKAFANVFKEYYENVYQAKIVFVSFLPDNKDGPMVSTLKKTIPDIGENLVQFRLNLKKPDLRKLDSLLDMLTMDTGVYDNDVDKLVKLTTGIPFENKINIFMDLINENEIKEFNPEEQIMKISI